MILGSGESGVGSAVLAKQKGFDVFVSDKSLIKDKYKILNNLESYFKLNQYRPCKICITKEKKV